MASSLDSFKNLLNYLAKNGIALTNSILSNSKAQAIDPRDEFDDTKELLLPYNIADRYAENSNWFDSYSRFGYIDPYNTNKKTKEYLFFTKPDLHLMDGSYINSELSTASTFFIDAIDRYRSVVEQLQYSYSLNKGPLAPLLSNAVTSSLELPSVSADYIESPKNVYQTMISYRGSSFKSDQDYEFSLDFKDTKFLDVYMYFKMYDEYERLKWLGQVSPPKLEYIKNKVLHDQFSIYKIVVAEDGMTILYFARAMGVYPTSVPRESISNIDGELTYSVSFKAQFVYDMDPRILLDLNRITASHRSGKKNLPIYDVENHRPNGTWAAFPVVYIRNDTSTDIGRRNKYYLMWVV